MNPYGYQGYSPYSFGGNNFNDVYSQAQPVYQAQTQPMVKVKSCWDYIYEERKKALEQKFPLSQSSTQSIQSQGYEQNQEPFYNQPNQFYPMDPPNYQFQPYTSQYNNEWDSPQNQQFQHYDQQNYQYQQQPSIYQDPPPFIPIDQEGSTDLILGQIYEFMQEQAREMQELKEATRNLENKLRQLNEMEMVEENAKNDEILLTPPPTPEVTTPEIITSDECSEEGMNLVTIELSIPSHTSPNKEIEVINHVEYVDIDIKPKSYCVVFDSIKYDISYDSGKLNSLHDTLNQSRWWGLSPMFFNSYFKGVLNSYDLCREKQRFALLWYNYP